MLESRNTKHYGGSHELNLFPNAKSACWNLILNLNLAEKTDFERIILLLQNAKNVKRDYFYFIPILRVKVGSHSFSFYSKVSKIYVG